MKQLKLDTFGWHFYRVSYFFYQFWGSETMHHIGRVLTWLFNLSNKDEKKPINRMETLKLELIETVQAYDAKITNTEAEYKRAVLLYEKAYSKVSEVQTRYRNKMVTEIVLKDEKEKLMPLEDSVRDLGHELDTLRTYKKEEILRIVGKMDSLTDSYVQEKAEEVKVKAYQLQQLKHQQLQLLTKLRGDYAELMYADDLIFKHLKDAGISYTKTMSDKLSMQTEDVPLTVEDIAIPETLVSGVMTGDKIPYELFSIVEEGKKQKYI
ncbi:hypothetical protein [Metabacillus idriensis]|nr:hypothetical protein [Metabacillus idriensis]